MKLIEISMKSILQNVCNRPADYVQEVLSAAQITTPEAAFLTPKTYLHLRRKYANQAVGSANTSCPCCAKKIKPLQL